MEEKVNSLEIENTAHKQEQSQEQSKEQEQGKEQEIPKRREKYGHWYEKLWYGNYSLWTTVLVFWMGGHLFLTGICAYLLFHNPNNIEDIERLHIILTDSWTLLSGVGVWRAAKKYTGFPFWKVFFKIIVAIAFFRGCIDIIKVSFSA